MRLFIKLDDGTILEAQVTATAPWGVAREITLPEFIGLTEKLAHAVTIDAPYSGITTEAPNLEG